MQAAADNIARAHFMLGTCRYKHTLSEYVILSAVALLPWLHEHATLYVHCLVLCFPNRQSYR